MNTTSDLRRFAIARSLFPETTLLRAISRLGFVQADPIRAPARAQDLTLRLRVKGYRAGDLERRYEKLPIEEDYFINYGFLPREHVKLMHPRKPRRPWDKKSTRRAEEILAFVSERGRVHPREVDAQFAHGSVKNYWGGSSSATTHLLDGMHYRGMLRVVRREQGIRVYEVNPAPVNGPPSRDERHARADALVALCVKKYAPLPSRTLTTLARHLRYGAPDLADEIKAAAARALKAYPRVSADGLDYLWPDDADTSRVLASAAGNEPDERVRLLAPFDPIVWDRLRFTAFFGWAYKFEAYTPEKARKLGYYALPLLFRDAIIGWGNLKVSGGVLVPSFGYVLGRPPKDRVFTRELDLEVDRIRTFLSDR
jgi:uncharacterized protein YcaQ